MVAVISAEDVFALQNAILEAALAKTAPGRNYLSVSDFREVVSPDIEQGALLEMLRELVAEGILQQEPAGGEGHYCVSPEYLASASAQQ